MKPKIIIVDKENNIIGYKDRNEKGPDEISRATGLWVTNSKGEVLLAQRAHNKRYAPGRWGPAAAGTVEEGETYESNIIKETEEELGIKDIQPIPGTIAFGDTGHKYFRQAFSLALDKPISEFKLQDDEVIAIKWVSAHQLKIDVVQHPEQFIQSMSWWIEIFCK